LGALKDLPKTTKTLQIKRLQGFVFSEGTKICIYSHTSGKLFGEQVFCKKNAHQNSRNNLLTSLLTS
jgi:hypothetical protein